MIIVERLPPAEQSAQARESEALFNKLAAYLIERYPSPTGRDMGVILDALIFLMVGLVAHNASDPIETVNGVASVIVKGVAGALK